MNNAEGGVLVEYRVTRRMHKLFYEAGRGLNVQSMQQSYVGS